MRRHRDRARVPFPRKRRDHVASPIHFRVPPERPEPLRHPLRPFLLKEGGRRNPAKFQMMLIDPAPFPSEPAPRGPPSRRLRKLGNGLSNQGHQFSSLLGEAGPRPAFSSEFVRKEPRRSRSGLNERLLRPVSRSSPSDTAPASTRQTYPA